MAGRNVKRWTEAEDAVLRTHYAALPTQELLALLPGRTDAAIKCRACAFGLKRDHEVRAEQSRRSFLATCEARGQKPGQQPVAIGTIHRKGRYRMIKVAQPDVWKSLHVHTWEEAHGPIPAGMKVAALDGDFTNVDLSNLELRTICENRVKTHHHYRGLAPEVLDILHLQNEIKKLKKRKRGNEKQAIGPA